MKIRRKQTLFICLLFSILSACSGTQAPAKSDPFSQPTSTTPCIEISASQIDLKVGDVTTVVGTTVKVKNPTYFGVEVKDSDADDYSMFANLLAPGKLQAANVSQVLRLISADPVANGYTTQIMALKTGTAQVMFFVSAEDYCGTPLGSGTSASVKITVNP